MSIFNRYYKRYDAWYDKNRFAYLSELAAIKKVLPDKEEGLEIGVGTARFAAPLGIRTGIDPARNMVGIARQRGVHAKVARGERLPFKKGTFDYVVIIITLCFVKNPQKVLKETKRVLKKKGKIIIGIINKNSFLGKSYQKKKSVFYKQANFFTVKEVKELLKAEGFNRPSYYQTLFKPLQRIDSIEKPVSGFGKGGFVVIVAQK